MSRGSWRLAMLWLIVNMYNQEREVIHTLIVVPYGCEIDWA